MIEDVCQAAGGTYRGKSAGRTRHGGGVLSTAKRSSVPEKVDCSSPTTQRSTSAAFALHDQGHRPAGTSKDVDLDGLIGLNFKMKCNLLVPSPSRRSASSTGCSSSSGRRRSNSRVSYRHSLVSVLAVSPTRRATAPRCSSSSSPMRPRRRASRCASGRWTLADSGWHVYGHMRQVAIHRTPVVRWTPASRYDSRAHLPRTDELLRRAIAISVGVVDAGLGAGFGVSLRASDQRIVGGSG